MYVERLLVFDTLPGRHSLVEAVGGQKRPVEKSSFSRTGEPFLATEAAVSPARRVPEFLAEVQHPRRFDNRHG
jgi:hypothetical protein